MPTILSESFYKATVDARLSWYNPPKQWEVARGHLVVRPDAKTDFWQATSYGFRVDNGHFLFTEVEGDFTLLTKLRFKPAHPYDQGGLMVRLSPECWIKTSVEYETDGPSKLGVVVTNNGYSDWSTQDFGYARNELVLRLTRKGNDYLVEASPNGYTWQQLRVAHLQHEPYQAVQCGLYACSPVDEGYEVEFSYLRITRPIAADAAVSLREITADNLDQILMLSETLDENHRRMVAPNAVSVAQGQFSKFSWQRAIYAGEDPVGYVMVYIGPKSDNNEEIQYFLWRYMVGAPYQGKGYGRQALEQVMQMAREQGAKEFFTSCGEGKGSPEGFYRCLGFARTGVYDGDEVVMRIDL